MGHTKQLGQAVVAVLALGAVSGTAVRSQAPAAGATDKYVWLEDVSGERAMKWVTEHDAQTAAVLRKDPNFAPFQADALRIGEDKRRLAFPQLHGDLVYNFWQDAANPRGLLRVTGTADYATPAPHWRTLLDVDALNKAEGKSWVYKGMEVLQPEDRYALVRLSAGGEDADEVREFDLRQGKFVPDGFVMPRSKQEMTWVDHDTLLVARDWGAGTMTASGYPFVVKEWKRGTPLESATEVFRGSPTDIRCEALLLRDGQGHTLQVLDEGLTFFESKLFVRTPRGVQPLALPPKANVVDLLDGEVLVRLRQDWTPAAGTSGFKQGSLVSLHLADVLRDPAHLRPQVVFAPTATEFLDGSSSTKNRLIVTTLNHVQGGGYTYTHSGGKWTRQPLAVPPNVTVDIASANDSNDALALTMTGFLTPTSLVMGDAGEPKSLRTVKSQPALFDAANLTVEQLAATSRDGTQVPYFIVHRKDMKYDGGNATLLNAYGGFESSETPDYSGVRGKLWLERGGVFVLANIRGGGEFGPAWHEAGLKTNRQRIYDDFAAVGKDLVARKITSPRHLGIIGGSNGDLLMGVEMEQNPTLWNAVVIQVPLLDMLGYEHIAAGASWVGEYGSVTVPKERAFLATISPYNNLKPDVTYPEPLIFTTTKDDRVGPQHARKFAALMEEQKHPFLYDEIVEGGHGSGADIKQTATTNAETFVYLTRKLME